MLGQAINFQVIFLVQKIHDKKNMTKRVQMLKNGIRSFLDGTRLLL